jgi:RNA polymerase primary sigma factor
MLRTDTTLATYLDEIGRRPLLTRQEEERLGRRASRGDAAARGRLLEANLRLVVWTARRCNGMGLDFADLVQEGNVGLMRAVERYDPDRGSFAACARWWIRQAICRALSTQSRLMRVPLRLAESSEFRRSELAPLSLAEPVGDDVVLADVLSDDGAQDPARAVGEDPVPMMREAVASLEERRRRLLELRFGLDGGGERTLAQVAGELGVSAERVRRIEERALWQLSARPELQVLRAA